MTEQQKAALITQSWQMHEIVEQCYLDDPAAKGEGTTEKNEAWSH